MNRCSFIGTVASTATSNEVAVESYLSAVKPLWRQQLHSPLIYYGDAFDFVQSIPDNSVHLVLTSPPYNLGKSYEKKSGLEDYLRAMEPILPHLVRILHPNGNLCWQVGNYVENGEIYPLDILYYPLFKALGLHLRNRIVWHFGHGLHAKNRFSGRYETILWFSKSDTYVFNLDAVRIPQKYPNKKHHKGAKKGQLSCNPLGKNPSDFWTSSTDCETDVWEISNIKHNHPEKTSHPCQFPLDLATRCVLALSHPGDIVFDPFLGSGTTLLAALMHNRRGVGCEKEWEYVQIAQQRLEKLVLPVRDNRNHPTPPADNTNINNHR